MQDSVTNFQIQITSVTLLSSSKLPPDVNVNMTSTNADLLKP